MLTKADLLITHIGANSPSSNTARFSLPEDNQAMDDTDNYYMPFIMWIPTARQNLSNIVINKFRRDRIEFQVKLPDLIEYYEAHPRALQWQVGKVGVDKLSIDKYTALSNVFFVHDLLKLAPLVTKAIKAWYNIVRTDRDTSGSLVPGLLDLLHVALMPYYGILPYQTTLLSAQDVRRRKTLLVHSGVITSIPSILTSIAIGGSLVEHTLLRLIEAFAPAIRSSYVRNKKTDCLYIDENLNLLYLDDYNTFKGMYAEGLTSRRVVINKDVADNVVKNLIVCYNCIVDINYRVYSMMFKGSPLANTLESLVNNGKEFRDRANNLITYGNDIIHDSSLRSQLRYSNSIEQRITSNIYFQLIKSTLGASSYTTGSVYDEKFTEPRQIEHLLRHDNLSILHTSLSTMLYAAYPGMNDLTDFDARTITSGVSVYNTIRNIPTNTRNAKVREMLLSTYNPMPRHRAMLNLATLMLLFNNSSTTIWDRDYISLNREGLVRLYAKDFSTKEKAFLYQGWAQPAPTCV